MRSHEPETADAACSRADQESFPHAPLSPDRPRTCRHYGDIRCAAGHGSRTDEGSMKFAQHDKLLGDSNAEAAEISAEKTRECGKIGQRKVCNSGFSLRFL